MKEIREYSKRIRKGWPNIARYLQAKDKLTIEQGNTLAFLVGKYRDFSETKLDHSKQSKEYIASLGKLEGVYRFFLAENAHEEAYTRHLSLAIHKLKDSMALAKIRRSPYGRSYSYDTLTKTLSFAFAPDSQHSKKLNSWLPRPFTLFAMYEVIKEICGHDNSGCICEGIADVLAMCGIKKAGNSIQGQINEAKERIESGAVQLHEYPLNEEFQARRRKAL